MCSLVVFLAAVLLVATAGSSVDAARALRQEIGGSTTLHIDWVRRALARPPADLPPPPCPLFSHPVSPCRLAASGPRLR